jgi:hypothetical protein
MEEAEYAAFYSFTIVKSKKASTIAKIFRKKTNFCE